MKNTINNSLPLGTIAENNLFSYGYNGKTYWVAFGVLHQKVTLKSLTFDQAKALFDALTFIGIEDPSYKLIDNSIKQIRKQKITSYNNLFWFFTESI